MIISQPKAIYIRRQDIKAKLSHTIDSESKLIQEIHALPVLCNRMHELKKESQNQVQNIP